MLTIAHPAYFDLPMTHIPLNDAEAYPYLPPELPYQALYVLLRAAGTSVAEALLATLKERRDDLAAMIARYEIAHAIAP